MQGKFPRVIQIYFSFFYGGPGGRATRRCLCDDDDATIDDGDAMIDDGDATIDDGDATIDNDDATIDDGID